LKSAEKFILDGAFKISDFVEKEITALSGAKFSKSRSFGTGE